MIMSTIVTTNCNLGRLKTNLNWQIIAKVGFRFDGEMYLFINKSCSVEDNVNQPTKAQACNGILVSAIYAMFGSNPAAVECFARIILPLVKEIEWLKHTEDNVK